MERGVLREARNQDFPGIIWGIPPIVVAENSISLFDDAGCNNIIQQREIFF